MKQDLAMKQDIAMKQDMARMDILAGDLVITDTSLRRVFDSVKSADLIPSDTTYDRAKFVDDSYLNGVQN